MKGSKHFFFDLDGTLARSRMPMDPEHVPVFLELTRRFDVLVISGTTAVKMRERLPHGSYYIFAENGNVAFDREGNLLWKHELTREQKNRIFALIEAMKEHLNLSVVDENDLVEDRDIQVTYSLIGHHEDLAKKESFDPGGEKRRILLKNFEESISTFARAGIEVRIGGTTSIDFFPLGRNKASNIIDLMERQGWKKEDAIYFGDALYPHGNDEVMIGVIKTRSVRTHHETFAILPQFIIP